jgi:hypothetical protein
LELSRDTKATGGNTESPGIKNTNTNPEDAFNLMVQNRTIAIQSCSKGE